VQKGLVVQELLLERNESSDERSEPRLSKPHHHFGDCRSPVPEVALPSYFFQKFLVDVEIGVDVLHVVLIFERFH